MLDRGQCFAGDVWGESLSCFPALWRAGVLHARANQAIGPHGADETAWHMDPLAVVQEDQRLHEDSVLDALSANASLYDLDVADQPSASGQVLEMPLRPDRQRKRCLSGMRDGL